MAQQSYQVGGRSVTGSFSPGSTGEVTAGGKKYKALTVEATVTEGPGRPATRTVISYAGGIGIIKQEIFGGKTPLVLELDKFETEPDK